MLTTLKLLASDDSGVVLTEYGLLATLIAIVALISVKVFGLHVGTLFSGVGASI